MAAFDPIKRNSIHAYMLKTYHARKSTLFLVYYWPFSTPHIKVQKFTRNLKAKFSFVKKICL